MKRIKKFFLSVIFATATVFGAQAATSQPSVTPQRLTRLLDKAKAADAVCPHTCGLMNTIDHYHLQTNLVTSDQLNILAPGEGAQIVGRQQGNHIYLNAAYSDAKLLESIAHEVRHAWQKRDLSAYSAGLDPRRAMILTRFREADAFAFAMYFTYRVEQATGKTLVKLPSQHPYYRVYGRFKAEMDKGADLKMAYAHLIDDCFRHVRRVDYDGDALSALEEGAARGVALVPPGKGRITDAQFTQLLRQMGRPGFGDGSSTFDSWTDAELLDLDRTGGIADTNLVRLQALETRAEGPAKASSTPLSHRKTR